LGPGRLVAKKRELVVKGWKRGGLVLDNGVAVGRVYDGVVGCGGELSEEVDTFRVGVVWGEGRTFFWRLWSGVLDFGVPTREEREVCFPCMGRWSEVKDGDQYGGRCL